MKAIDLHNEISAVINEIGDYRKLDNPTITGYEFQVIQLCSLVCPKELILPMLKETAKELKTRPTRRVHSAARSFWPAPRTTTQSSPSSSRAAVPRSSATVTATVLWSPVLPSWSRTARSR